MLSLLRLLRRTKTDEQILLEAKLLILAAYPHGEILTSFIEGTNLFAKCPLCRSNGIVKVRARIRCKKGDHDSKVFLHDVDICPTCCLADDQGHAYQIASVA